MKLLIFIIVIISTSFAQEAPQKITKTSISAEGSIQGGTSPFTLLGTNFKHLFSISRQHDFSFTIGAQYQKIAGIDIRNAHVSLQDDLLINDNSVFFTTLSAKRDDLKKQRILASAVIGYGHDFLGQYNRGDDAKYSIGFGYQYEDAKTENYNDLIFTHRFKYDYTTNKSWGIGIILWFKHILVSGKKNSILSPKSAFKTLESSFDIKLKQKAFLGRKNLDFHIALSTSYDNDPIPGTTYFNYLVKLGFDFILSEK